MKCRFSIHIGGIWVGTESKEEIDAFKVELIRPNCSVQKSGRVFFVGIDVTGDVLLQLFLILTIHLRRNVNQNYQKIINASNETRMIPKIRIISLELWKKLCNRGAEFDSHQDIGRGKFFSFWASERFPEQFFETG